ncbi:MAG: bifunctional (p)ppGpp synthetase/guanosine-3',5'-bis(diphosphate) 3'-pyrophosphohydrolase [Methylobacter sp.]|nr:bifunctional (p)ppGpp synthetase/guanosine-3',5'-bis(diphosphate) 3'-pyrophosphohydrolase [Methylobacter sp.]MDP2099398.1 bifunctional (p)ppGpp synthetase/guanosine-3',5'-bis(diphosphate) 3'-pyrophosphohydrolase [Methylobacter sp.]MDP2429903.1 bifunctional (p)ppGpp synthetase/guanosine-3',5'-bis(diphosphate) 3'-pyrophosphohydrolase [Methylobacter sp.]MDP3053166.1 bifunctional (p)ppGpp synthetase/guanosine-3',5'-bis(diphosphate) 3'-pyrophosphohydrolase [Methylobacter sp.]MDP3360551.1 bifuncti
MQKNTETNTQLFSGFSAPDTEQINRALAIVGQIPEDPHYYRPKGVEVAAVLLDLNIDLDTVLAAILSDPRLAHLTPKPDIKAQFSETVATLVDDVNWLNKLTVYSLEMTDQPNQTETLRRMLLSMTRDVRAVLIKLAYRVQRLKVLPRESYELRRFIAQETLDIYAPIANRMGIHQLKWELEDMAFRYLDPQAYLYIAKSLTDNRVQRENCINNFIALLQKTLAEQDISAGIYGRPKHIYSIWKKMRRKQLDIDELYDLLAVRVIVDNLTACYATLGVVHSLWQTVPKEFDDYIANPKENGYQSLHTVIIDADGNRIEVQIRTQQMHDFAELGVAAHWSYKEGGKHDTAIEKNIASLRKLLDETGSERSRKEAGDEVLSENFRSELFNDRVYVLTPAGKLIDLVKGSTPLDFAYAIHTEVGHRCRGAKINGRIVPLTYQLKSGEQVKILTAKDGGPNHNWIDPNLGYLKTSAAISKVKSWFKNQQQAQNIAAGKTILDKEAQRLGVKMLDLEELTKHFHQPDTDRLLEAIGRSDISSRQLAAFFKIPELDTPPAPIQREKPLAKSVITVDGIHNVLTSIAQCCSPIQGNDIIGYISHKKGITIHRKDCENIRQLSPEKQNQLIPVSWGDKKASYAIPIVIHAFNAHNLLNDVSQILAQAKIHISNAALDTHPDFSAQLNLTIQVENTNQLSQVLNKISQLPTILDVKRKT